MTWLSVFFSLYSLVIAIVYTFALLLGYRLQGLRGLILAAGAAFLLLAAKHVYMVYRLSADLGASVPAWIHAVAAVGLMGQLLLPALLVHRVTLRNAQALPVAAIAGVAGYFVAGLIMAAIGAVVVIIVASSRL
jgi:hypothetical protein